MLIWLIVVLIVITYVLHYTKVDETYNITQTYIEDLTPEILKERHPIIVYDMVPSIRELLKTLFAYQYIYSNSKVLKDDNMFVNISKHMIIQNIQSTVIDVNIISPRYSKAKNIKDVGLVTMKLKPNQFLILPYRWIYQTPAEISVTVLDDVVSYIVSLFGASCPAI